MAEDVMKSRIENEPLTDAELDCLAGFLKGCKGGRAMNIEELDGFLAALIAGPETVMPSEYYPEVFGGAMSETCEFGSLDEAKAILGLMMRHWNTIAATLLKGEVYLPLLLKDENGVEHGNDWARGFMRGMHMRHDGWAELINDDEHVGCLIPVMMLCHEYDGDPTKRPKPISPRQREKVITYMAAGLLGAYRYFGPSGRLMQVASKRLGVTVPRLVETSRVHAGRKRNTRTAAAVPLSSEPQGSARLSQAEQRLGVAHPS